MTTGTIAGLVQDALSTGVIGIGGLAKTIVGFGTGIEQNTHKIAECLDDCRLRSLYREILDLGMTPLVELHDEENLPRVLDLGAPPEEFVERVLASSHTRLPLWRNDPENIVGVLHAKDLLRALMAKTTVSQISPSLKRFRRLGD